MENGVMEMVVMEMVVMEIVVRSAALGGRDRERVSAKEHP